jgi:hypothetical protein
VLFARALRGLLEKFDKTNPISNPGRPEQPRFI